MFKLQRRCYKNVQIEIFVFVKQRLLSYDSRRFLIWKQTLSQNEIPSLQLTFALLCVWVTLLPGGRRRELLWPSL